MPSDGRPVGRAYAAKWAIGWVAVLSWICAAPIHAGQLDYGVGLSLVHDSNIGRVEADPQSELTRVLVGGFFYRENTVDATARILAQLERRHYYRQSYSDETGGSLDGAGVWTILPRQLAWTVEDVFRELQVDVTASDTPSNRTRANSFSTGPDITLFGNSVNSAIVGGRYGRFDIENSNADNRRYSAYARGRHNLSQRTAISVNYEVVRADFEPGAQAFSRILRADSFGRFENDSPNNNTILDVGTSRLTQYGGPPLAPSRLVRLTFAQTLSSQSKFHVSISDQISDTYSDLIKGVTGTTAPGEEGVALLQGVDFANADIYRSRRGGMAYVNSDRQFRYTLQVYGRHVDLETLEDYRESGGRFGWTWTPGAIRFNAFADYTRRRFENLVEDTYRNYGAGVTYRVSSNVSISIEGARAERESTVQSNNFVNRQVGLLLGLSSGLLYEARPRR